MKIAIVGGHLSPSLAVIDALPKEAEIIFIGRKNTFEGDSAVSLEYKVITERGIPFYSLKTGRLQRSFTKHTFPSLFKLPQGYVEAVKILKSEKVSCVVSFGGYISLPVAFAARTLSIPLIIHEQTMQAGMANKIIGKFAQTICLSWESSQAYFDSSRSVLTGNPLRKYKIGDNTYPILKSAKDKPFLFITGGSAGSHVLNTLVEQSLLELLQQYRVLHQTGDAQDYHDFERLTKIASTLPNELKERYALYKFIEPSQIKSIFENADLVIGRSGVNTVTELLYFGTPSLLIPLSTGQRNEQWTNASFIQEKGMGILLPQDKATKETLLDHIQRIVHNTSYKTAAAKGKIYVYPGAAAHIVEIITDAATKKITQKGKK